MTSTEFTSAEKSFIGTVRQPGRSGLAHIATATADGKPHVVPVRALLDDSGETVMVLGHSMAQSYKYRQVQRNEWVAIVWDSVPDGGGPAQIEGVEVRGPALIEWPEGDPDPHLRVTPTKIFSWGLNEAAADSFAQTGMDVSHLR